MSAAGRGAVEVERISRASGRPYFTGVDLLEDGARRSGRSLARADPAIRAGPTTEIKPETRGPPRADRGWPARVRDVLIHSLDRPANSHLRHALIHQGQDLMQTTTAQSPGQGTPADE